MSVEYRLLHKGEEDAVIDLWAEAYARDRERVKRRFYSYSQQLENTRVAIASDGTLLSAVQYWLRTLRDAGGEPRFVGHVVNVATRAYARGQGHAGRLLELTIEAMQQDGCSWSLLFTGDEARPLYERYGWHTYLRRWPQGTLFSTRPPTLESYTVHRYDPMNEPNGWEMLGQVYREYNAKRPLSVVRDLDYWRGFAAMRFSDWTLNDKATILAATRTPNQHNICGYVLAHFYGDGFAVTEIAARHGDEEAVEALLAAV